MNTGEWLWQDGWKDQKQLLLSENRAFLYGDGFFESMRWSTDRSCQLWPFHWDRMQRTIKALHFPWPESFQEMEFQQLISEKIEVGAFHDWRVKIIFWRHGEGKYAPENNRLAFFLTVEPYFIPWVQTIDKIGVSKTMLVIHHPFSWVKSTSAISYVMAGIERVNRELDDLILPNPDGYLVEGSSTSLFWSKGEQLFLTDPSLGGLDSCMRRYLEQYWKSVNLDFKEVRAKESDLEGADWIGFGSGMGLRIKPITQMPKPGILPFD